jgi:hypothetical protein
VNRASPASSSPSRALVWCTVATAATALWGVPAAAQDRSIFQLLDTGGRVASVDGVTSGRLSADDLISPEGHRVQAWSLAAGAGDTLQIDLRSEDFDTYLYVVGPGLGSGLADDDSGLGLDSRVCLALTQNGDYRVVASSLSGELGDFTIEVHERPGATAGACPDGDAERSSVSDVAELPVEGRTLAVGDESDGYLDAAGPSLFGSPAQAWAVEGRSGTRLSVDMHSEDFDAYLIVQGPGLESWLQDDDGAGGCDARVTWTFPADGTYRVVATSLRSSGGRYQLVARSEPEAPRGEACVPTSEGTATTTLSDVRTLGGLTLDNAVQGQLSSDDGTLGGRKVQAWTLEAKAGGHYAVDLGSEDFDSYLALGGEGFGPDPGDFLTDDDGGDEGLDSRICVETPVDGTYTVYAGPLSTSTSAGRYTLRATESPAESVCKTFSMTAAAVADALAQLPTEGRTIRPGQELEATLDPGAVLHPDDERPIQPWALDASAGQQVSVDVLSDAFDPVLYVVGPGLSEALFADDVGDGCNARVSFASGGPGTVLLPGAYYAGAGGAFRLRVSLDPAPALEDGGCVGSPDADPTAAATTVTGDAADIASVGSGADRVIAVGTEVVGTLGSEEALATGEPAQAWTVVVPAGQEFVFELLADDFDPVLYLDRGEAREPLKDDDSAGNLGSRIEYTSDVDTTLRLVVTSVSADAAGRFRLRVIRKVP